MSSERRGAPPGASRSPTPRRSAARRASETLLAPLVRRAAHRLRFIEPDRALQLGLEERQHLRRRLPLVKEEIRLVEGAPAKRVGVLEGEEVRLRRRPPSTEVRQQ